MDIIKTDKMSAPIQGLSNLSVWRQIGVLAGLAISVALGVYVALWVQTPNYTVLFSNLNDKDTGQVIESLNKADIAYKIDHTSGAILVAFDKVHAARLKLAMDGLPKGTNMGYELLEKDRGFGESPLLESVRFQRALEGELSRSIQTLQNVESARVHLALPKQSVFVRERKSPSASVILNLFRGRVINEGQVAAIVHLVAASVPNMTPEAITVIDQSGQLLTGTRDNQGMAQTNKQFEIIHKLEQTYIKRIEDILSPLMGANGLRAQVVADIDFTVTEQTQESFNPDMPAVRKEVTVEEKNTGSSLAAGVPGALSNQPPAPTTAAPNSATANAANQPQNNRRRSAKEYELDRTVSYIKLSGGMLKRLSVAVLVNHKESVNKEGLAQRVALTADELTQMTALVKEAVGFDPKRGDSVNVINAPFTLPAKIEALPETPLWERPWVWTALKQVLFAAIIIVLIFTVLRPLMKTLASKAIVRTVSTHSQSATEQRDTLNSPEQMSLMQKAKAGQLATSQDYEARLDVARDMVKEDPKRVANVVKTWLAENE